MDWRLASYVAGGSALGGGARFSGFGWGVRGHFPARPVLREVVRCFLIGLLVFGGMAGGWMGATGRAFFAVGILGGFTTMSTFSFETLTLWAAGDWREGFVYVGATLLACLMGTAAGRWTALRLWSAA